MHESRIRTFLMKINGSEDVNDSRKNEDTKIEK
jgi:hypothetical protein